MTWIIPLLISILLLAWAFWALIREWCGLPAENIVVGVLQVLGRLMVASMVIPLVWLAWALISPARAHEAPSGVSYPYHCCSGLDCRKAEPGEIRAVSGGWEVAPTGEVIPFDDERVQPPIDSDFHRCTMIPLDAGSATRCLIPPGFGS